LSRGPGARHSVVRMVFPNVNQYTITLITATTAMIAGIAGPFVAYLVARKQIRASVISNNRELWIVALRDSLAEYIAIVASAELITRETHDEIDAIARSDRELLRALERGMLVRSKILLMTDPDGTADRELHESIEAVYDVLVKRQTLAPLEWRARIEAIMYAGRTVMRAQWARVKRLD
jgi:hypothetical protein